MPFPEIKDYKVYKSSKYTITGSVGLFKTSACSGSELFNQNITLKFLMINTN